MMPFNDDAGPSAAPMHVPHEIVENIVLLMDDPATLATMMRVSRDMFALAAPRLYCEVTLSKESAHSLYLGLKGPDEEMEVSERTRKEGEGSITRPGLPEGPDGIEREVVFAGQAEHDGPHDSGHGSRNPTELRVTSIKSKLELLSMVRHLHVRSLPYGNICEELVKLAAKGRLPTRQVLSLSLQPNAVWELMYSHVFRYESVNPNLDTDPHLNYLRLFNVQDMCVQLPGMDDNVDRSMLANRSDGHDYTRYHQGLRDLRDALSAPLFAFDRGLDRFFDLFEVKCRNLTIHNLVLISCDRACRSVNPDTKNVQAFFRPCACQDKDLISKVEDGRCIDHPVSGNLDIADGEFRFNREVLSSPQQINFVDIDWVRGPYDSLRDDGPLISLRTQVESQMQEYSEEERATWGKKRMKMSNEVDQCRCCHKRQLSAAESSISFHGPF